MPAQTEKNLRIDDLIDMLVNIEHEHGNLPVRVYSATEGSFPLLDVSVKNDDDYEGDDGDEPKFGTYCLIE